MGTVEERAKVLINEMYGCVACSHGSDCHFWQGKYSPSQLRECGAGDFYDGYIKCDEEKRKQILIRLKDAIDEVLAKKDVFEVKRLQVGDWFYRPDCFDIVTEIRNGAVIGSDPLRGLISAKEIKPAAITRALLEMNADGGYSDYGEHNSIYHIGLEQGIDSMAAVYVEWGRISGKPHVSILGFGDITVKAEMMYVHQLQQAFRMCGREELSKCFRMNNDWVTGDKV